MIILTGRTQLMWMWRISQHGHPVLARDGQASQRVWSRVTGASTSSRMLSTGTPPTPCCKDCGNYRERSKKKETCGKRLEGLVSAFISVDIIIIMIIRVIIIVIMIIIFVNFIIIIDIIIVNSLLVFLISVSTIFFMSLLLILLFYFYFFPLMYRLERIIYLKDIDIYTR